tara:strand:+ start:5217 stop:6017 length:801 start_codon:yes stop_codon:yes gene_type:complete
MSEHRHDDTFGTADDDFDIDIPPTPLTVVCLKWGDLYGPEYVHRLKAGVARHLKTPYQFVCLTDDPTGLPPDCALALPTNLPRWWGKLWLFSPEFSARIGGGRILFFDLDTVIVGSIDFLAQYRGPWACLSGFYHPFRCGSGVMSIGPQSNGSECVWELYDRDRAWAEGFCGNLGDGHWMQLCLGMGDRWQDMHPGKMASYKVHCTASEIPETAAVVNFHGSPRPHEVFAYPQYSSSLPWMREHWLGENADTLKISHVSGQPLVRS